MKYLILIAVGINLISCSTNKMSRDIASAGDLRTLLFSCGSGIDDNKDRHDEVAKEVTIEVMYDEYSYVEEGQKEKEGTFSEFKIEERKAWNAYAIRLDGRRKFDFCQFYDKEKEKFALKLFKF